VGPGKNVNPDLRWRKQELEHRLDWTLFNVPSTFVSTTTAAAARPAATTKFPSHPNLFDETFVMWAPCATAALSRHYLERCQDKDFSYTLNIIVLHEQQFIDFSNNHLWGKTTTTW
jgi:hypothetical protein